MSSESGSHAEAKNVHKVCAAKKLLSPSCSSACTCTTSVWLGRSSPVVSQRSQYGFHGMDSTDAALHELNVVSPFDSVYPEVLSNRPHKLVGLSHTDCDLILCLADQHSLLFGLEENDITARDLTRTNTRLLFRHCCLA